MSAVLLLCKIKSKMRKRAIWQLLPKGGRGGGNIIFFLEAQFTSLSPDISIISVSQTVNLKQKIKTGTIGIFPGTGSLRRNGCYSLRVNYPFTLKRSADDGKV